MHPRLLEAIAQAIPGLVAVYCFGSFAAGLERPDSDIDLAVLGRSSLAPERLDEIRLDLEDLAGRDVHLVDLRAATTVFGQEILSAGVRLLCSDEDVCSAFEALVYASYARLNEERRGILEDIIREGRVYAR